MNVQTHDKFELTTAPEDALRCMMLRQTNFLRRLGLFDERLSSMHPQHGSYVNARLALHNLDMARHEAHEAWDMLEGGWKHHKTKPKEADKNEVLMEMVDVAHFLINAYLYMAGGPSERGVAKAINQTGQFGSEYVEMDLATLWRVSENLWAQAGDDLTAMYGHGWNSYGQDWEKDCATAVNLLASKIAGASETMRTFAATEHKGDLRKLPAAAGFIVSETYPNLLCAVQRIPGVSIDHFWSAFIYKNDVNHRRQNEGY